MKKKWISAISIFLAALMIMTACGSSSGNASYKSDRKEAYAESSAAGAGDYEWAEAEEEAPAAEPEPVPGSAYTTEQNSGGNNGDDGSGTMLSNDKLVYTCNLQIETTEYQKTVQAIREKIRQYNAIVEFESENDNDYNWYYSGHVKRAGTMSLSMTIRVPVAQYDAFVTDAGDFGKVTSKSQNVENISRQYHSTEARIEALTKEEARLTEMLDKAETIEEMIYIEERLTDVEAELNTYKTNLATMDVDVAYSTVNLNVKEVLVYEEDEIPAVTFGQRVKEAFKESWNGFTGFLEGLLIVLIHLLPFIILGLVIAAAVVFGNRAADKKDPERRERRLRKKAEKKAAKERAKAMKRGFCPPKHPIVPNAPAKQEMPATQATQETQDKKTEENKA